MENHEKTPNADSADSEGADFEVTSWTGGVNNHVVLELNADGGSGGGNSEGSDWDDTSSEEDLSELEGEELVESLRREFEHKMHLLEALQGKTGYEKISNANITVEDWKKAEQNRHLGYNGLSGRSTRRHELEARKKATEDEKTQKRCDSEICEQKEDSAGMGEQARTSVVNPVVSNQIPVIPPNAEVTNEIFTGYASDIDEDDEDILPPIENSETQERLDEAVPESAFTIAQPPPLKRRRHDIPVRVAQKKQKLEHQQEFEEALTAIEKKIASKKNVFEAGRNGLQSYRARAIQSHLHMVVNNGRSHIEASKRAAESQGFAKSWGGRLVRSWVKKWVTARELPESNRGKHVKVFTLLEDPAIRAELRSYLRTNKWSMDPTKLAEFTKKNSIPAAAKDYIRGVINEEMPQGLKKYMEIELFPRIKYKVGKGMTTQQNDGQKKSWVLESEHALKKKGVGRGLHQSGVICSTEGYIIDAGQTLEYGKNYDGYWTGELFVKQAKKILPAFEKLHGPGFQALILVDNSQGHSAYSEDALIVNRMNLRPGGKQACMRNGWFIHEGHKVIQPMVFPPDHPDFPDQPKGMRQRWLREHCDYTFQGLQANLPKALESVALETIRRWEHRMHRWTDAYRSGLTARDVQLKVKEFSSKKYTSHCRVPETLARMFD
ncbi:hypothetical protein B0H34DRAFT_655343 [Crassisporium funariophilum]|nr:hypothetical protein B0H34DRAFT_655343 [Crassisporium funariophilum]